MSYELESMIQLTLSRVICYNEDSSHHDNPWWAASYSLQVIQLSAEELNRISAKPTGGPAIPLIPLRYGEPCIRRVVPLALAMLSASNPRIEIIDTLSKLSHDADSEVGVTCCTELFCYRGVFTWYGDGDGGLIHYKWDHWYRVEEFLNLHNFMK